MVFLLTKLFIYILFNRVRVSPYPNPLTLNPYAYDI